MRFILIPVIAFAVSLAFLHSARAQEEKNQKLNHKITVTMINQDNTPVGTVHIHEVAQGLVLNLEFHKVPEGWHGFHIHNKGSCIAPDFQSAGAHLGATGSKHGFTHHGAQHTGDLPNVYVTQDGTLKQEIFVSERTLKDLKTVSGTALVLHEAADDYKTDPAGNAGGRIACGVIIPRPAT